MAQSIIFISSQAFAIWGHGVALGTSWLSPRTVSPMVVLWVSNLSPSVPARLRARLEEIARKTKTARTAWRIFIFLSWVELSWVLSELRRLRDSETPPEDWDIYSKSPHMILCTGPVASVLFTLIRPLSDSYSRHVCTVLPPSTRWKKLFSQNWFFSSHFSNTRHVL